MLQILKFIIKNSIFYKIYRYQSKIFKLKKKEQSELVSIVVPNFNDSKFILETLKSIDSQSYRNIECIIVDDCSTDDSVKIVEEFIKDKSQFKLIKHLENKGLSSSRNTGNSHAKGEYLLFLDSDDVLTPHSILTKVDVLSKSNESFVIGVGARIEYCQEKGPSLLQLFQTLRPCGYKKYLHYSNWNTGCPFMVHSVLFRKKTFDQFSGFREDMLDGAEDFELWYRLLRHGYVFTHCSTIGGYYRQKKGSMLLGNFEKHFSIYCEIISKTSTSDKREVEKCPYWHEDKIAYYQEAYRKFDRYVRFKGYLGFEEQKFLELPLLQSHYEKIYSKAVLKDFVKRIRA